MAKAKRRLGICGYANSGKTCLIEQLIAALKKEGMRLAVVKHMAEPMNIDSPQSDTGRFYQAGATVLGYDGQAIFIRSRQQNAFSPDEAINQLGEDFDLVLIEGFKSSTIDKIWLLREGEDHPPKNISNIIAVLEWSENRFEQALMAVRNWLKSER